MGYTFKKNKLMMIKSAYAITRTLKAVVTHKKKAEIQKQKITK